MAVKDKLVSNECLKAVNDNMQDQVSDLKSAVKYANETALNQLSDWSLGYYGFSSGGAFDSTNRIRTNVNLPLNATEIIAVTGIMNLYAWNGSTYVGHWDGTQFTTANEQYELTYIDINSIRAIYPAYDYRITWRASASSTATITVAGSYMNVVMLNAEGKYNLSPMDFGAVGDGTTDDTAAIQKCINTAISYGRNVVFPHAEYLTSQISVTGAINIDGNYSALKFAGTGTSVIEINASTVPGKRCTIENFTLNMAETAQYGINVVKNINAYIFSNFQINNVSTNGIGVYMSTGGGKFFNFILRCNISDNTATAFDIRVVDSVIKDVIAVNFATGIATYGNTSIINYHPWNSFADLMTRSIAIYTESLVILTNSYIDTFAKCFAGTGKLCISGLMLFWSSEYYTDESVGDSTTRPIIFSGDNLNVISCDGMRVYPASGRSLTSVKYSDSSNPIFFNPRNNNLLQGVTDIPRVYYETATLTVSSGVTQKYTQLRKYNDTIVFVTNLYITDISVASAKSVATLPTNCCPKTSKTWVCAARKNGDQSSRAPVEVIVNEANGDISVRAVLANLTGEYVVQITEEYMAAAF